MPTLKSGGAVLSYNGEARQAAGHYIQFVLWFNFIAGFFYLLAGIGLWRQRGWGLPSPLPPLPFFVFIALGIHILNQAAYETRTVIAMTIRSSVWLAISITVLPLWRRRLMSNVSSNT